MGNEMRNGGHDLMVQWCVGEWEGEKWSSRTWGTNNDNPCDQISRWPRELGVGERGLALGTVPGRMIGQVCASAGSRSRWILIGLMMRISARARTESRIRVVIGRAPSYEEPTVLMSSHCSTPTFLCTAQSSLPLPLPSSSSPSLTQLYPYLPWNKSIYFNYRSISDWIKIN